MPGAYLVATSEGAVVGYAVGIIRYGSIGHIVSIAILGGYQGRGAGKVLLERLMEELAALGAKEMRLEVRESNSRAIGIYRASGFEEREKIKNYYADGESALVMRLTWSRHPRR